MPHIPSSAAAGLLVRAQQVLGFQQGELADLLGVSRRTVQRIGGRDGTVHAQYMHVLARAVHAKDPELAAALASEGGKTLETLGLVSPAVAPPAAPPVHAVTPEAPPARPLPPTRLMVESIVCAAAETMQTPPAAVRDVLRAAFARARGLGLTVEEVDEALSPPRPEEQVRRIEKKKSLP
ncbi:MAG TPA: antitoxin Xre-like helix-turn-helix domain-containing protein [Polyangiaceae bacterium]|jgi:hypothetical protein